MIHIQPVGVIDRELLIKLSKELERKFSRITGGVIIKKQIDLPWECYNPLRRQFNSTCILRRLEPKWITLGITDVDIYAEGLNFVFGEAELNGSRAIVSIHRLKGLKLFERLVKEATHEIGHVLGLTHCKNRHCVMSFSNSIHEVDLKTSEFCESCRSKLW